MGKQLDARFGIDLTDQLLQIRMRDDCGQKITCLGKSGDRPIRAVRASLPTITCKPPHVQACFLVGSEFKMLLSIVLDLHARFLNFARCISYTHIIL